jgi:hypothetical protein
MENAAYFRRDQGLKKFGVGNAARVAYALELCVDLIIEETADFFTWKAHVRP